ncbi:C-GCAxxG-C-C family protein [Lachnobacterium bovis]|uniref:C_GCAxxG_C_C family probable redox protein n=1 Tax=Lachnobacterium bovis DSM 14045 TaxID=1122142 RepID=A0A1H3H5S5_9FIRM|nr:C-GCAxxG-C-C family protein [Lachnobacterium bovis]MBQ1801846.1 C_GCAxxG_C_C family protein [Lachnobacterium sp.]SDY10680.1 C_GCAxxG_C_C family probable redox protein [Lachnobacterium bovis DSM 14045]
MDRREQAVVFKHNGYNCCQAVIKAYSDITGMNDELVRNLGSSFGGGMGCLEGTCGALVGAGIVAGCANTITPKTPANGKKLLSAFSQSCGDTICKNLKGIETGTILCSCDDCVRNAVDALEKEFFEK